MTWHPRTPFVSALKSPLPSEFRRSVELDAPVERVYAFHADPRNIPKISPDWQRVVIREGQPQAEPGGEFEIVVKFFGLLPLRWRGVWREAEFPVRLVDEAIKSPFAYWRHRHSFEPLGSDRTRMTDHVSYRFVGGWPGRWLAETVGRIQFSLMFADRHARTQRWMREHG